MKHCNSGSLIDENWTVDCYTVMLQVQYSTHLLCSVVSMRSGLVRCRVAVRSKGLVPRFRFTFTELLLPLQHSVFSSHFHFNYITAMTVKVIANTSTQLVVVNICRDWNNTRSMLNSNLLFLRMILIVSHNKNYNSIRNSRNRSHKYLLVII